MRWLAGLAAALSIATPAVAGDVGSRATWLSPQHNAAAFQGMEELFPSRRVKAGAQALPLKPGRKPIVPTYRFDGRTMGTDEFIARNHVSGLLVLKGQDILLERYALGADRDTRFISFSMGKSMVSTLVGLALADGRIASLKDPVAKYLPEVKGGAYETATIEDVLNMSSGTSFQEAYADAESGIARFIGVFARNQGGLYDFARQIPSARPPGQVFNYASADTEVLGMLVRRVTGEPLADYLSDKVWAPMGAEADARWMLDAPGAAGQEVAAGGVAARLRDYGRFGLLFARHGELGGRKILPAEWAEEATHAHRPNLEPGKLGGRSQLGYGYQWWLAPDRPGREGLFMAIGIHGQYILVDPKRDLVIVKTAAWPTASEGPLIEETYAFFDGVIDAVDRR